MIKNAVQLKDKVRNISHSDNDVAQILIRNFFMERFLERVSLSKYKMNFILKGGMLVAAMVGINMRATMDIDTTVEALPLNKEDAKRIIEEIIALDIEDGVTFKITKITDIMTDFEYPGIRMMIESTLGRMRQKIKIDISTDDVIIPSAIHYSYKLMFEDRSIEIMTYTPETLLAEKMQTIIARGIANTRMRDYYDVYELVQNKNVSVDDEIMRNAFKATCKKRKTVFESSEIQDTLKLLKQDNGLSGLWLRYRKENFYVGNLEWDEVVNAVCDYINEKTDSCPANYLGEELSGSA